MAKVDAEALNHLADLINQGQLIQIEKISSGYEVTIWPYRNDREHHHYRGDTLIEAILKIKH